MGRERFLQKLGVFCFLLLYGLVTSAESMTEFERSFDFQDDTAIIESITTNDVNERSLLACSSLCLANQDCCAATFFPDSICRLETSCGSMLETIAYPGAVTIVDAGIDTKTTQLSRYTLINTKVDFDTARSACGDIGMDLVTIKDDATFNEVTSFLSGHNPLDDMWVGMHWNETSQNFDWTDTNSEVTEYIRWTDSEPNCMTPDPCNYGNPNQKCVRLTPAYCFMTIYCESLYYPLCQRHINC